LELRPEPFSISAAMAQACIVVKDIAQQKKINPTSRIRGSQSG